MKSVEISEILKKLDSHVLVIFSKKGFFLENSEEKNFQN